MSATSYENASKTSQVSVDEEGHVASQSGVNPDTSDDEDTKSACTVKSRSAVDAYDDEDDEELDSCASLDLHRTDISSRNAYINFLRDYRLRFGHRYKPTHLVQHAAFRWNQLDSLQRALYQPDTYRYGHSVKFMESHSAEQNCTQRKDVKDVKTKPKIICKSKTKPETAAGQRGSASNEDVSDEDTENEEDNPDPDIDRDSTSEDDCCPKKKKKTCKPCLPCCPKKKKKRKCKPCLPCCKPKKKKCRPCKPKLPCCKPKKKCRPCKKKPKCRPCKKKPKCRPCG